MTFIVAIDGPVGVGKSSVARAIAQACGFLYLNTGNLYRALALAAQKEDVPLNDEKALCALLNKIDLSFIHQEGEAHVLLNHQDVSREIRGEKVSQNASVVSQWPDVRRALLDVQRLIAQQTQTGVILEGRDIGTVVFPNARLKFFLTASQEERARRRWLELIHLGLEPSFEEVFSELQIRDARDTQRSVAPLQAAVDAIIMDTTLLSLEEVVNTIVKQIKEQKK